MSDGWEMIRDERCRQVVQEGWTPEHDDEHERDELTYAALAYLGEIIEMNGIGNWPWGLDFWKPSDDPVRNLVKAGALIAAEIDRIQRKQMAESYRLDLGG